MDGNRLFQPGDIKADLRIEIVAAKAGRSKEQKRRVLVQFGF
jgi:hypothetical protein